MRQGQPQIGRGCQFVWHAPVISGIASSDKPEPASQSIAEVEFEIEISPREFDGVNTVQDVIDNMKRHVEAKT